MWFKHSIQKMLINGNTKGKGLVLFKITRAKNNILRNKNIYARRENKMFSNQRYFHKQERNTQLFLLAVVCLHNSIRLESYFVTDQ